MSDQVRFDEPEFVKMTKDKKFFEQCIEKLKQSFKSFTAEKEPVAVINTIEGAMIDLVDGVEIKLASVCKDGVPVVDFIKKGIAQYDEETGEPVQTHNVATNQEVQATVAVKKVYGLYVTDEDGEPIPTLIGNIPLEQLSFSREAGAYHRYVASDYAPAEPRKEGETLVQAELRAVAHGKERAQWASFWNKFNAIAKVERTSGKISKPSSPQELAEAVASDDAY